MQGQEEVPRNGTEHRHILDGLAKTTVAMLGEEGTERSPLYHMSLDEPENGREKVEL